MSAIGSLGRALAALIPALTTPLAAQSGRGLLRGTIVAAESGEPLAFAVVVLDPGFRQQFASEAGAFVWAGLAPGTWRLRVRQVGYQPADTTLSVLGDSVVAVRVALPRVPVQLATITVTAEDACLAPGAPDPARDTVLAVVFDQLRENAARYRLLADQYPFSYRMVRTFSLEREDGTFLLQPAAPIDDRSNERRPYRPGRVVGSLGGERVAFLPTLADLADTTFHATHCFRLGPGDSLGGRRLVRLDFKAALTLRASDVDGSAWLDAETFQLRRLGITLTNVHRARFDDVTALSATATFRELLPSLIVAERVTGLATFRPGRDRLVGRTEEQRLTDLRWLRETPGEAPRP